MKLAIEVRIGTTEDKTVPMDVILHTIANAFVRLPVSEVGNQIVRVLVPGLGEVSVVMSVNSPLDWSAMRLAAKSL